MTTDDQNTTGSESLCAFNKSDNHINNMHAIMLLCNFYFIETPEDIIRVNIAGIVVGSILFGLICLLGTCVGIYFGMTAKKPCVKPEPSVEYESPIKLNYLAIIERAMIAPTLTVNKKKGSTTMNLQLHYFEIMQINTTKLLAI